MKLINIALIVQSRLKTESKLIGICNEVYRLETLGVISTTDNSKFVRSLYKFFTKQKDLRVVKYAYYKNLSDEEKIPKLGSYWFNTTDRKSRLELLARYVKHQKKQQRCKQL